METLRNPQKSRRFPVVARRSQAITLSRVYITKYPAEKSGEWELPGYHGYAWLRASKPAEIKAIWDLGAAWLRLATRVGSQASAIEGKNVSFR
jgi:hypothetical protein